MKKTERKWLIYSVISMVAAIIIFILSQTLLKDVITVHREFKTDTDAYLSFNTNYAQVDSPLTVSVHNAPGNIHNYDYKWSVDGKVVAENNTDTYIPTEDDLENFISVEVTYDGYNTLTASLYCSKLPVIYINTDEKYIGDEYKQSYISMQGSPEYTSENTDMYFGEAYIKLRGNSTKYRNKRPYKIKLEEACNLYGMGTSKHWVLLANDIDHTHIRNKLVYDLSGSMGASFAAQSINVVLIYNNSYQGVYQLCEQIRIADERLDIYDWERLAKDAASMIISVKKQTSALSDETAALMKEELSLALATDLSWLSEPHIFTYQNETYNMTQYVKIPDITGGFLLEMDFYSLMDPAVSQVTTNYGMPFYVSSPSYASTNSTMYSYIQKYIQTFEYALHSEDFIYHEDETHYRGEGLYYDWNNGWVSTEHVTSYTDKVRDGLHYSQLFNMDSLVNNWLICEFTMNWDSMKNSVFVYKDITGLAYLAPVWDFDWAFGNKNMFNVDTNFPEEWHTTFQYFTTEQYYQSEQWNRYLIKDPYFLLKVYEKYKSIRPTLLEDIIKDGGSIDSYYDYLFEAAQANDVKWSRTYREYNGERFEASMTSLRTFINKRLAWMDEQFISFDNFVKSLGYYKSSNAIKVEKITANSDGTYTITASTTHATATGISFQINGTTIRQANIVDGKATVVTNLISGNDTNIVVLRGVNSRGDYISTLTNYQLFGGAYDNE